MSDSVVSIFWRVLLGVAAALILAADLAMPLGVAGGVPYLLLVLLSARLGGPRTILATATTGIALTLLGWFLSSPGSPDWVVFTNRVYTLLPIALAAFLLIRQKRNEESLNKYAAILAASHDHMSLIDRHYIYQAVNPAYVYHFGKSAEEIIGRSIAELHGEEIFAAIRPNIDRALEGEHINYQAWFDFPLAGRRYMDVCYEPYFLEGGRIGGMVVSSRDITERKEAEEEIRRLAMSDPLTGLANRTHFNERLEEALQFGRRFEHRVGLMLMDLDHFKPVNDTYGHPVGDAVLVHVGRILRESFREVDTVARLGGDEFAVVLSGLDRDDQVTVPAEKVIARLGEPFTIDGRTIHIGVSIGISFAPDDGDATDSWEPLYQKADSALYRAKHAGRNTYCLYRTPRSGSASDSAARNRPIAAASSGRAK